MAARHSLHVAVTEPLRAYVGQRVASGHYASASEVVRAALRLLIEREAAGAGRTDQDHSAPPPPRPDRGRR